MNKRTFTEYISESNFSELFIREMGWNNPRGQQSFDLAIEGENFTFQIIAERNGFQVMTCQVAEIPSSSICKKIDTRLRRQANDYICIFHLPHSQHHLWVVPVKKVEKRDLVLVEYETAERAGFLFEKVDDLTFDLDERTTIMDVKERVQAGFIINSEKITKDFYTGFRKEHTSFAQYITGIDDYIDEENKKKPKNKQVPNRNKQWYTSVMLNRLMFCYFIQKKGFLDRNVNYLRDKLAWVKCEKGEDRFYGTFYQGFLLSLFHDGLNSPRHQSDFEHVYGHIPYLNGGMFSIHELEEQYPKLDIADEAFESLFAFFDQWHWHLDDRLTASGKDINPDVLGYIFEQYINDRAQMGAYYTKEDITEYIGRNTILPFLMDDTKKADERPFKANGTVWQFLRESGDRYIFDAVKKGHDIPIPEHIAVGIDTSKPNLLERRSRWNERTPEDWALPTEIWRETIERLQRYNSIKTKIEKGEITEINDFITYNLDIRQFVQDFLAQTDDHKFVLHFYHALQRVTILDPTCGSGAFLFAALNILEPLYETCIDRMQAWASQNSNLFKDELQELNVKYRSNIRYFIYKSIILRNLYGVDIMVEATEIAKLRLFLKMVAVVDVNPRDPNLGLEPLPDVDFNIRCGNTLVGYATEKEMQEGVQYMDLFAQQEFEQKVNDEMTAVSKAYDTFKHVQLGQETNLQVYKEAKTELKKRLAKLNEILNQTLHTATAPGMDYDKWKQSHQPFHWLAEYYDIIKGNGGFDVVIGNPPYVVYRQQNYVYKVPESYETYTCGNLFAFVLERCIHIMSRKSRNGYIIPISGVSNDKFVPLQSLFLNNTISWYSCYSNRPGKLFDNVEQRLTIVISQIQKGATHYYSSDYHHWYVDERPFLLKNVSYHINKQWDKTLSFYKIGSLLEETICTKLYINGNGQRRKLGNYLVGNGLCFYHNAPTYFIRAMAFKPNSGKGMRESSHYKQLNTEYSRTITCILNSSIYYWFFKNISNCRDYGLREISPFPIGEISDIDFAEIGNRLQQSYVDNRTVKNRIYPSGLVYYEEYYPAKSKPIIDEIDKVLAKHYGFTEEELDFIINYDIKYRMGDELNE